MSKNKLLFFITFIIAILVGIGGGLIIKWQIDKKMDLLTPYAKRTITENTTTGFAEKVYLIDGTIKKIYSQKPFKIDMLVRVYKFLPNTETKEIVKTIIAKEGAQYLIKDLKTNVVTPIDPSSFIQNNEVAVWIIEPLNDILKLEQLTAVKLMKFK